jgi:hypothetical protein
MLHLSWVALNWKSRLCFFSFLSCSFAFCFIFLFFVYCQNVVVHLFHVDFGFNFLFFISFGFRCSFSSHGFFSFSCSFGFWFSFFHLYVRAVKHVHSFIWFLDLCFLFIVS